MGGTPVIIHFRIFHHQPTIFGYPHCRTPPIYLPLNPTDWSYVHQLSDSELGHLVL